MIGSAQGFFSPRYARTGRRHQVCRLYWPERDEQEKVGRSPASKRSWAFPTATKVPHSLFLSRTGVCGIFAFPKALALPEGSDPQPFRSPDRGHGMVGVVEGRRPGLHSGQDKLDNCFSNWSDANDEAAIIMPVLESTVNRSYLRWMTQTVQQL